MPVRHRDVLGQRVDRYGGTALVTDLRDLTAVEREQFARLLMLERANLSDRGAASTCADVLPGADSPTHYAGDHEHATQ